MRVVTDHEELELIGEGLPIFHGVRNAVALHSWILNFKMILA
jgi:hypothetical protein